MTDDEFKRHLHKQLEEDKKNSGILTHRLFNKPQKEQKTNNKKYIKSKKI